MTRPFKLDLTKAALQISHQYSQRSIELEKEEIEITRTLSQKSINSRKQQEEPPRELTKPMKIAALFIRNAIRSILRKHLRAILSRFLFHKIGFKLLLSKKKRHIEEAFLILRNFKVKTDYHSYIRFHEKHHQTKLLAAFISKKIRQNCLYAFEAMRSVESKKQRLIILTTMLCQSVQRSIIRCFFADIFSKIRSFIGREHSKEDRMIDILRIDQLRIRCLSQQAFNKIADSILFQQWQSNFQARKSKNQQFTQASTSRKQIILKLRQQFKTIKVQIDQQKLAKNKVFQERKKYNNSSKLIMAEAVKKFQKQLKAEEAITNDIQLIYNQKSRKSALKQSLIIKASGAQLFCTNLYAYIQAVEGQFVKNLPELLPEVEEDISRIKDCAQFLFKNNAKMQKLSEIYEKRQAISCQSQYYELQYQNNVVRQMIKCFMKQKMHAEILLRQKWQVHIEQNQENFG